MIMKNFDSWLSEQSDDSTLPSHLPSNVWDKNGRLYVNCCMCGRICEVEDRDWLAGLCPDDDYEHYCGGGPGCIP